MRITCASAYLVLASLAACADPAGPQRSSDPSLGTFGRGAHTEKGESILVGGADDFIPCLGEVVRYTASVPYKYHLTTTPTGVTTVAWHFIPGAGTGTAVGLTTGSEWTLAKIVSPEVDRFSGQGGQFHWTANVWWDREGGPTLHTHSNFLIEQNAAGELTVVRAQLRTSCH